MRALMFHTKWIEFISREPSTRPSGVAQSPSPSDGHRFEDVAVAFLCIEEGDVDQDANKIKDEICSYANLIKRKILLVPFVHLTSTPANSECALRQIKIVKNFLLDENILVGDSSFGYHKEMRVSHWETNAHPGDVAFRDSKFMLDKRNI